MSGWRTPMPEDMPIKYDLSPEEVRAALGEPTQKERAEFADAQKPKPGQIVRNRSHVDEAAIRQLALEHAVTTHGATVDQDQIVVAAKLYLAFLTGTEPADLDRAKLWDNAAAAAEKDKRLRNGATDPLDGYPYL